MVGVTEKLAPGGEVPRGECAHCGAFLYIDDLNPRRRARETVREKPAPSYSVTH